MAGVDDAGVDAATGLGSTGVGGTKAVGRCIGDNVRRWRRCRAFGPIPAGTLPAMWVRVDSEACTGHGRCYSLAPEMFGADEVGHCVLLHEEVPAGLEDQARLGVQNCPEQAISVED